MIRKVVSSISLVALVALTGCSDSKESIEKEKKELEQKAARLMADCMTGAKNTEECNEEGKEIDAKMKELKKRYDALEKK